MREGEPAEECDDEQRCDIIPRTMLFRPGDAEYPAEWRYNEHDAPICTAFIEAGKDIPPARCEQTYELF